jgi:N-methylhydantoinase A
MQSNGGLCEAETGGRYPVRLIESGPAAGALAAAHHGLLLGHKDLLSFDMGGTTAKACVIADGEPLVSPEFEVDRRYHFKKGSGLPIKVPVIEMIEIGTGGGSIARVDALRRLVVGPESAGARPGPVAYGLGGTEPTVTDADLVLGYLDPEFFLGGQMRLDANEARRAIAERVARPLGLDPVEAAWGIHQLANESMAGAARIHAIERGKDVERFPIFAFGGAGPVHAFGVARILRSPSVIYPLGAGVMSAVGFLVAPLSFDFVRTLPGPLDALDWPAVARAVAEMEAEGLGVLGRTIPAERIRFRRYADMRYRKQATRSACPSPTDRSTPRGGTRSAPASSARTAPCTATRCATRPSRWSRGAWSRRVPGRRSGSRRAPARGATPTPRGRASAASTCPARVDTQMSPSTTATRWAPAPPSMAPPSSRSASPRSS